MSKRGPSEHEIRNKPGCFFSNQKLKKNEAVALIAIVVIVVVSVLIIVIVAIVTIVGV